MAKREMPKKKNEEEIVTPDVENAEEVTAPVEETPVAPVDPAIKTGTVYNCSKLNIRKKPDVNAAIVTAVDAGQKLVIDEVKSTNDFFRVTTENNIKGYCMKKYVKIEK